MVVKTFLALMVSIPAIAAAPCTPEDVFKAAEPVMNSMMQCATDSGYDFTALGQVPTADQLKKIQSNKVCQDALTKLKGIAPDCEVTAANGKTMTFQQALQVFLTTGQLPMPSLAANATLLPENGTNITGIVSNITDIISNSTIGSLTNLNSTKSPGTEDKQPSVTPTPKPSATKASSANALVSISSGVACLLALSVLLG